eukprot:1884023-Prymnesium_polylepis.1
MRSGRSTIARRQPARAPWPDAVQLLGELSRPRVVRAAIHTNGEVSLIGQLCERRLPGLVINLQRLGMCP